MTKKSMEYLVKRYQYIARAVKKDLSEAVFYVGNRKNRIPITEEVKTVFEIINLVYKEEEDTLMRRMMKGIMTGEKDRYIMRQIHYGKNAYYPRKNAFMDKLFNLCIYRKLVSFDEILKSTIM